jgi:hypothetical protein
MMLPLQFFGQNLHFALSLFAALVLFAVFWLYFDAWLGEGRKKNKDVLKWAGFLLVSLSFVIHATLIEQTDLGRSVLGGTSETIATILRLLGYVGIIIGQLVDPLQKKPVSKGIEEELQASSNPKAAPAVAGGSIVFGAVYGLPLAAGAIAVLYWRRATTGLERHLKPVALAFGLLFCFELLSLSELWQNTSNPNLFNLVKAFGPLWIISHGFLLAATLVLGRWVWRYLTERFLSQLFMIFTGVVLAIFLLTTVSFTYLLMRNIQNSSLDNLATAANVLNYALDSKKAEARANAEAIAQNPKVAAAILAKDHKALAALTDDVLKSKKLSSVIITTSSAQVLLRAEQPDRWGDSVSSDPLVRKALIGQPSSTVVSSDGVLAPILSIKSAVAVRDDSDIVIGTVSTAVVADNAFVDGIKNSTGLDSAIYSANVLSATTLTSPDGKTRQIGIKQNSQAVKNQVLTKGQTFKGSLNISNRPFLAVYAPLKDVNNNVAGMLFIGQPQSAVLKSAGHSIELTFTLAIILMALSIIPAYLMARYITRQLQ